MLLFGDREGTRMYRDLIQHYQSDFCLGNLLKDQRVINDKDVLDCVDIIL